MKTNINPLIYLFFMALMACNTSQKEDMSNSPENTSEENKPIISLEQGQIKKIGLVWGESTQKQIATKLFVNGKVDVPPQNQAVVHAKQEGFIQSIKVLSGELVRKGQVLAVLENRDYLRLQENYLTLKSELAYLQQELKRQEELRAADINAQKTLQQVKRDVQIKQAQEASLRQQLALLGLNVQSLSPQNLQAYFSITSPINGYVESVNISIGEFVQMNKALIGIKGTEHKHIELMVFEKEITQVAKGQKVIFQLPSLGQEKYEAEVFLVGQSFDKDTKAVNVHAHILDPKVEEKLIPGMFVNAHILLPAQSHRTLPEEAIIQEGKNHYVFLKGKTQGNKVFFEKIAVKVFNSEQGRTAFIPEKTIAEKAQFVQKGTYYLQAQLSNTGEEE